MSKVKLNDIATGNILRPRTHINKIHRALIGDLVPRDSKGQPATGQKLGNTTYLWSNLRVNRLLSDTITNSINFTLNGSSDNEIISGKTRSDSNFPDFLQPAGSGNGLSGTIEATATNLILLIQGVPITVSSDVSVTSLTAAPSTNNTCQVQLTQLNSRLTERTLGEWPAFRRTLPITSAGTEITGRIGEYHMFVGGGNVFYARIFSSTVLDHVHHCYCLDENGSPMKRDTLANADTYTLLHTTYIFLEDDGSTVHKCDTNPSVGPNSPGSPTSGDFWLDTTVDIWKTYNGTIWVDSNATFLGVMVTDNTDCLYSRCQEFYTRNSRFNSVYIEKKSTTVISGKIFSPYPRPDANRNKFFATNIEWDTSSDYANSIDTHNTALTADQPIWLYVSDDGDPIISDFDPYFMKEKGFYQHPLHTWRCVGLATINSTPTIENVIESDTNFNFDEDSSHVRAVGSDGATITTTPTWAQMGANSSTIYGPYFRDGTSGEYVPMRPGLYRVICHFQWNIGALATSNDITLVIFNSGRAAIVKDLKEFAAIGPSSGSSIDGSTVFGYIEIDERDGLSNYNQFYLAARKALGVSCVVHRFDLVTIYIGPR